MNRSEMVRQVARETGLAYASGRLTVQVNARGLLAHPRGRCEAHRVPRRMGVM